MRFLARTLGVTVLTLSAVISSCIGIAQAAPTSAIPRGFTLDGLEDYLPVNAALEPGVALPADRIDVMEEQIQAARYDWHANVVRLQVIQDKLVGANGRRFSPAYMQDITQITNYALGLGLNVVLNAQTEVAPGFTRNEPLPTAATSSFWRHVIAYYKNNMRVIFDLFNEPRHCTWAQWRVAMQGLVNLVRRAGARNTLWVQGRWWGSTLAGVPLLHGRGIVYSFHHPGSPWPYQAPVTEQTWQRAFGYLADRGIPVVDGEFVNFSGGYHWKHAAVMIPKYLRFLAAHHIGMTAWTLGLPGVLNATPDLGSTTAEPRGCGRLLKAWFARI